jgi:hypothetical protein
MNNICGGGAAGGHAAVRQTRTINLDARSRDACRSRRRSSVPKHQGRPVQAAQSPRKRARAPAIGRWCSKRHQRQLMRNLCLAGAACDLHNFIGVIIINTFVQASPFLMPGQSDAKWTSSTHSFMAVLCNLILLCYYFWHTHLHTPQAVRVRDLLLAWWELANYPVRARVAIKS